jgi:hypothetical protein
MKSLHDDDDRPGIAVGAGIDRAKTSKRWREQCHAFQVGRASSFPYLDNDAGAIALNTIHAFPDRTRGTAYVA